MIVMLLFKVIYNFIEIIKKVYVYVFMFSNRSNCIERSVNLRSLTVLPTTFRYRYEIWLKPFQEYASLSIIDKLLALCLSTYAESRLLCELRTLTVCDLIYADLVSRCLNKILILDGNCCFVNWRWKLPVSLYIYSRHTLFWSLWCRPKYVYFEKLRLGLY